MQGVKSEAGAVPHQRKHFDFSYDPEMTHFGAILISKFNRFVVIVMISYFFVLTCSPVSVVEFTIVTIFFSTTCNSPNPLISLLLNINVVKLR